MDIENQCPIPAPRLIKVKSIVVTCYSCGTWIDRYPAYLGDWDGEGCERCGSSTVNLRQGRAYGPRSREWAQIVSEWETLWHQIPPFEDAWEDVVTEPRFSEIDFDRIRKWNAEQGIYTVYIRFIEEEGEA